MRYLIDDHELEPDTSRAIYRVVLTWAAVRSERFVMGIDPSAYDEPGELSRLIALAVHPPAPVPSDPRTVRIEGVPDEHFIQILTTREAPPGAVAGDLSPCEDIELYRGTRILFACYDYGRTQMLTLEGSECQELRETFRRQSLDPTVLKPAPPHLTQDRT